MRWPSLALATGLILVCLSVAAAPPPPASLSDTDRMTPTGVPGSRDIVKASWTLSHTEAEAVLTLAAPPNEDSYYKAALTIRSGGYATYEFTGHPGEWTIWTPSYSERPPARDFGTVTVEGNDLRFHIDRKETLDESQAGIVEWEFITSPTSLSPGSNVGEPCDDLRYRYFVRYPGLDDEPAEHRWFESCGGRASRPVEASGATGQGSGADEANDREPPATILDALGGKAGAGPGGASPAGDWDSRRMAAVGILGVCAVAALAALVYLGVAFRR